MHTKRFQVFGTTAAKTVPGKTVPLLTGYVVVTRALDGYLLDNGCQAPIVVAAREFDRLLLEGHLHSVADPVPQIRDRPRQPRAFSDFGPCIP